MKETFDFLGYAFDILCFVVPKNDFYIQNFEFIIESITVLSVLLLSANLIYISTKESFNRFTRIAISVITILSTIMISGIKQLMVIVEIAYIPVIFVFRFTEGIFFSNAKIKVKLFLLVLILIVLAYFLIPQDIVIYLKIIWAIVGVGISATTYYNWIKDKTIFEGGKISKVLIIILFISTITYINKSKIDYSIYQILFPIGICIGTILKNKRIITLKK